MIAYRLSARAAALALPMLLTCLAAPPAAAGAAWSGQIGASTDYVSKGVSKTNGDPQLWGRLEAAHGGAYAGAWASNVELSQRSDAELQVYVGRRAKAFGYALDVSAFYKTFPGTRDGVDEDLVEFRADAARAFGPVQARLRAEWTPDNFGAARQALWVEGRLGLNISAQTEVSGALGRREQAGGADYLAWNLGVKQVLAPHLSADLRWCDTDGHRLGDNYRGRLTAGLTASF
ncbi:TorF family putative porin [Phenylobacterium sp.]|uniref:TorF family putative porin n=1 Tax=Phenylobacterium sp. TaxID=1871053 RepID=UPI002FCAAE76